MDINEVLNLFKETIDGYFNWAIEAIIFTAAYLYVGALELSVFASNYLPTTPLVYQSPVYLALAFNIYWTWAKHFNLFTYHYSSRINNSLFFITELVLLIIYSVFTGDVYAITISDTSAGLRPLMMLQAVLIFILLWSIIEGTLLYRRPDIMIKHRPNGFTIMYLLQRYYLLSLIPADRPFWAVTGKKPDVQKTPIDQGTDNYFEVTKLLTESERARSLSIDLNFTSFNRVRFALRYHELFGKVPFFGLFLRIIITPFVALLIAALYRFMINTFVGDEASVIVTVYDYLSSIAEALAPLNIFIFGAAFMPTGSPSFEVPSDYTVQKAAMFIYISMIIVGMAKGLGIGRLFYVLVWIYAVLNASVWLVLSSNSFSFFEFLARDITRAAVPDGFVGWVFSYSGFDEAISQISEIDPGAFYVLMIPGVVFWFFAAVRLTLVVEMSRAGSVTYRSTMWLPFISRGRDAEAVTQEPDQLELPLFGGYTKQGKVVEPPPSKEDSRPSIGTTTPLDILDRRLVAFQDNPGSEWQDWWFSAAVDGVLATDLTDVLENDAKRLLHDLKSVLLIRLKEYTKGRVVELIARLEDRLIVLSSEKNARDDDTQSSS